MTQQSFSSFGVGRGTRGADHRVDGRSRRGREKRKQRVKAALLRRREVREVGVEDEEPELRTIFPKIWHFAIIEAARCS